MRKRVFDHRLAWLVTGMVLGMTIAYYCPTEPAYASSAVGGDKFSMCTVPTLAGNSEAVFILDSVTGRLFGAAYNTQTGTFTHRYARNLAADFRVSERAQYMMVSGQANLQSTGGGPPASGAIYVGEMTSGIVAMYGFAYIQSPREQLFELVPIAQFPWRQGG